MRHTLPAPASFTRSVTIPLAGAIALALVLAGSPASADELWATLGQPLTEVAHEVEIRLGVETVTYVVRRTFANAGTLHEEATLDFDLPPGAAGTGLRIRARDVWYAGELMEAEKAARLYEQLTGLGASKPRDPAILTWTSPSELHLQVFPVEPGGTSTVEYTLTAPLRWEDGRYIIEYPTDAKPHLATPVIRVVTPDPLARVSVDGVPVRPGLPIVASDGRTPVAGDDAGATGPGDASDAPAGDDEDEDGDSRRLTIHVTAPGLRTIAARLGRVELDGGEAFVRFEVDAAAALSALPKRASVVFVLDASRSAGEDGIGIQIDVARAFAAHLPDAAVEVVVFRRRAVRLLGAFAPAPDLSERLGLEHAIGALDPGNGSNLDEGLRLAATALAGRKGPCFIVALTDGRMRARFDPAAAARAVAGAPPGTVVHVVLPERAVGDEEPAELRDEKDPLAAIPRAHGGILLRVTGVPLMDRPFPKEPIEPSSPLGRVALGLVRPIRIDAFRILGAHLVMDDGDEPLGEGPAFVWDGRSDGSEIESALVEGAAFRSMVRLERAPVELTIRGLVWARPFARKVRVSASFSRATAAFVFSAGLHEDLNEGELMRVALLGGAVSPVTSYLAIEPGVRPSTAGIDRAGTGSIGLGLFGTGAGGGGSGEGTIGFAPEGPDLWKLLHDPLERCTAAHGAGVEDGAVEIEVETTGVEVVNVRATGGPAPLRSCVVEVIWALELGPELDDDRILTLSVP